MNSLAAGEMHRPFAAPRVCDFFKIAKNQRCKQYSYGDKNGRKIKKVTNSQDDKIVGDCRLAYFYACFYLTTPSSGELAVA